MTRDEVLARLKVSRAVFDEKLAAVRPESLDAVPPGSTHSMKDIVAHVTAYDDLIVLRLISARHGSTTAFDRDRDVFAALLHEVGQLSDDELGARVGATAALDPAWLEGRAPWQTIGIDAFDHYPMHYDALDAAPGIADR